MKHYVTLSLYKAYYDLKAESSRNFLGIVWWLVEPLLYMSVFYLVFGKLLSPRSGGDYVTFLLIGLVVWKWFASVVALGSSSLLSNMGLMRQVYVPKYVFPLSSAFLATAKFCMVMPVLMAYLIFAGYDPSIGWLWLFPVMLVQFLVALGVGATLASFVPFLPQIRPLVENFLMLLFFLSGVFFNIRGLGHADLLLLNPVAKLIDMYRIILMRGDFDVFELSGPLVFGVISVCMAYYLLGRFDRTYPKLVG